MNDMKGAKHKYILFTPLHDASSPCPVTKQHVKYRFTAQIPPPRYKGNKASAHSAAFGAKNTSIQLSVQF